MARTARKEPDDTGEIKTKDFAGAVRLWRNDSQNDLVTSKDVTFSGYDPVNISFDAPVAVTVGQTYYLQLFALDDMTVYYSGADRYPAGDGQDQWVWQHQDINMTINGALPSPVPTTTPLTTPPTSSPFGNCACQ